MLLLVKTSRIYKTKNDYTPWVTQWVERESDRHVRDEWMSNVWVYIVGIWGGGCASRALSTFIQTNISFSSRLSILSRWLLSPRAPYVRVRDSDPSNRLPSLDPSVPATHIREHSNMDVRSRPSWLGYRTDPLLSPCPERWDLLPLVTSCIIIWSLHHLTSSADLVYLLHCCRVGADVTRLPFVFVQIVAGWLRC